MNRILALAALCAAGAAQAAVVNESEPNNSLATADDLGTYGPPGDGILVNGSISSGDVDWFGITITDVGTIVSIAFALPVSTSSTDGLMQLTDAGGTQLAFDDDSGLGFMPSLEISGLAPGTYYIALTGFGDSDFNGSGHTQNWDYQMVVGLNIIPTPGALALLGLGGLAAARRRR
jgi:hypothetical protein